MKYLCFAVLSIIGLSLASCNSSNQQSETPASSPEQVRHTEETAVAALPETESQPGDSRVPLAPNDVTILFPLPTRQDDLETLLSIGELSGEDGGSVFTQVDFDQMIALAEGEVPAIGNKKIKLDDKARNFANWKIAGIRFDPSAPGDSKELIDTFGRRPQLRLVIQPVSANGQQVVAHDVAIHLIFDFIKGIEQSAPGVVGRSIPDDELTTEIVEDLAKIKAACSDLGIETDGELSVHPGLTSNSAREVSGLIKSFLSAHLNRVRFNSGAIMGLNNGGPEPWIFLSMLRVPVETGKFVPLPSPGLGPVADHRFAQMISFLDQPNVQPVPSTTNRGDISADLRLSGAERRGVSTAVLFTGADLAKPAQIGLTDQEGAILDKELTNADIVDWIANPEKSHFFNTDCISCHTESTRRVLLNIPRSQFAFRLQSSTAVQERKTMPASRWNVRNFGWFKDKSTISMRTENETMDVVEFINREILKVAE